MKLDEGIHVDVPMDDYVRDPAPDPSLSTGVLHDLIYRTPSHAWWGHPRLNPAWADEESTRGDIGSAIHASILGGKKLVFSPPEFTDWRKKGAQEFRDAARANGEIGLLESDRARVETAAKAARALLVSHLKFQSWETEGTMVWREGKIWKRGRYDIWCPSVSTIVDIKTCLSANPAAWIKTTLTQAGYDIQAEHYLDGIRNLAGVDQADFFFLLVEINPPHACSLIALDPAFSDFAKRKIAHATSIWRHCIETGHWPGYSIYPHWAELAPWHEADLEMRMAYAKEVEE